MSGTLGAMRTKSMILMPMLALALVAHLLLAATFGAQSANTKQAFSTGGPVSTEELMEAADAVFSGEVVAVEPVNVVPEQPFPQYAPDGLPIFSSSARFALEHKRALVTFDVEESWKGVFEEPVVVLGALSAHLPYSMDGSSQEQLEERFHEGDRLLVFANTSEDAVPDQPDAERPRRILDLPDAMIQRSRNEQFDKEIPLGTMDLSAGMKPLDEAEAELLVLGPAERAFPESVEPESVEPESVDPTPVSSTRENVASIAVVASGALLFVGALGILTFWRWRRLTDSAPDTIRR